jgi:hypothetical protein
VAAAADASDAAAAPEDGQAPMAEDGDGAEIPDAAVRLAALDADLVAAAFEELVGRVKARESEDAERRRRNRDRFASMLRHLRKLGADTTWDAFVSDYDREPEFKALGADDARPLFDEYVAKLKRKAEKREARKSARSGSDSEGSDRSRSRDGSRDRSRSRDRKHKKKTAKKHDRSDDDEERKSRKHKSRKSKDKDRGRDRSLSEGETADA